MEAFSLALFGQLAAGALKTAPGAFLSPLSAMLALVLALNAAGKRAAVLLAVLPRS